MTSLLSVKSCVVEVPFKLYCTVNNCYKFTASKQVKYMIFKGALDKFNIIPNFFPKKSWDFYTVRSVGMSKDCMPSFAF